MIILWIGLIAYVYVALNIFYKCRETDEERLMLKLIGYCLLGALSIPIKKIIIPIGFVYHIFRFKAEENREIKRSAATMGLIIVVSTFICLILMWLYKNIYDTAEGKLKI